LRVTNTGVTAIVSPKGKIVTKAPLFKQAVLTGNIIPMGGMTPYARLGDHLVVLIIALFLCFLYLFFKKSRVV